METGSAAAFLPERVSLKSLREAARGCTACPLWRTGTQTVFGEGLKRARLVLVGEQPGDREDLEGRPFVGPAGRLLDEALAEAGIERADAYLTNAVKHFKWEPRGKRRIHQKPNAARDRSLPAVARGRARGRRRRASSSASARPRPRRCSDATSA